MECVTWTKIKISRNLKCRGRRAPGHLVQLCFLQEQQLPQNRQRLRLLSLQPAVKHYWHTSKTQSKNRTGGMKTTQDSIVCDAALRQGCLAAAAGKAYCSTILPHIQTINATAKHPALKAPMPRILHALACTKHKDQLPGA